MARETIMHIPIDEIVISDERRAVDMDAVKKLAASIKDIGLQHPITVRSRAGAFVLVAGRHRVEACRSLGEENISAAIVKMDDVDAEMWEISENLHRSELKPGLARDELVNRWIELSKAKRLSRQIDEKSNGRPEGGVACAARDLGISEPDARRAVQVASLTPQAKEAARESGLDSNRSVLLAAAKEPAALQAAKISEIAAAKIVKSFKVAADPLEDVQASEKQVARLMDAWNAAGPEARQEFMLRIDQPVMDRRYA